jgi:phosphate transport system substrate-binding protein
MQREVEDYFKKNPHVRISITGGGSGVGIAGLRDRSTDIAMLSRKVSLEEKYLLQSSGVTVKEIVFAYDALAVIVHPSNTITQLNRQQVEDIYCGVITNWKELGGPDLKIIVYSRETSSGTHEFFKEMLLNNKNYKMNVLNLPASGAILQSVSQTPGAIAYIGLAYLNSDKIKAVNLSLDGVNYFKPTLDNAINNNYPFVRPLYLCYDIKEESRVQDFIKYVIGNEGQETVKRSGYVPIKKTNIPVQ